MVEGKPFTRPRLPGKGEVSNLLVGKEILRAGLEACANIQAEQANKIAQKQAKRFKPRPPFTSRTGGILHPASPPVPSQELVTGTSLVFLRRRILWMTM